MLLLVSDDDVDVVLGLEAVVHCAEESVGVWREVDTDNFRTLVRHYVEESRVLVSESVVILSPNSRSTKCRCTKSVYVSYAFRTETLTAEC